MVTATYKVRTRNGRTVKMTGAIEDLDEITKAMQRATVTSDLLAACEAFCNVYDFERKELRTTKTARDWDTVVGGIVAAIAAAKGDKN